MYKGVTLRGRTASYFVHLYHRLQLPVSSTCTLDIFRRGSLNLTIVSSAVFLLSLAVFALIPLSLSLSLSLLSFPHLFFLPPLLLPPRPSPFHTCISPLPFSSIFPSFLSFIPSPLLFSMFPFSPFLLPSLLSRLSS